MRKASWPEARNALERVKSRLGERGSHDIRGRLDRGARDLELADRLDAIRLTGYTMVGGVPDFARSDERYEEAFREAGFDEVGSPLESLAAKIKASDIRNALLVAFDNWSPAPGIRAAVPLASDMAQQAGGDTADWRVVSETPRSGRTKRPSSSCSSRSVPRAVRGITPRDRAPHGCPRQAPHGIPQRPHERHPRDFRIHGVLPSIHLRCPGHERRPSVCAGELFTTEIESERMPEEVSAGPMRPIRAEPVGGRLRLPGTTADHGGPRGIGARRPRGTGREPQESGECRRLAGVPPLPGMVPGPSSPGPVHRRRLRGRCRCVSRGMCRASLGDAFGRVQKLRKVGGGTFSPPAVGPVPASCPTLFLGGTGGQQTR